MLRSCVNVLAKGALPVAQLASSIKCCIVSVWTPVTSLSKDPLCTGAEAALGGSAVSAASPASQMHSAGLGQALDPAGQPGRAPLITSDLFGSAMQAAMSSLEQTAPQVLAVRGLPRNVS